MDQPSKPRRRWFQISLRNMLLMATVICIFCAYLGWARNWIRQRREFLNQAGIQSFLGFVKAEPAPLSLRLLGENGTGIIILPRESPDELVAEGRRLFPEADVQISNMPPPPIVDADLPGSESAPATQD